MLEDGVDGGGAEEAERCSDRRVERHGDGYVDDAPEKVAGDGRFGKPSQDVVPRDVETVHNGYDRIEHQRIGAGRDTAHFVHEERLYDVLQQRDRQSGVKQ